MTEGYGTGLLVVTNAAAGGADDERVEAVVAVLSRAHDVRRETCAAPGDLDRVLAGQGRRTLVVVGGDGSVHTAVGRLHARGELDPDRPIGLVPLGTGNDLARTLGIPLDPAEAAQAFLTGSPRRLDLVVDDEGGVVVNAAHLGIGAEAADKAAALKDRLGKAAYAVGSVAAGAGRAAWRLRVVVDGVPIEPRADAAHDDEAPGDEVLMVAVANGRTIGGGAPLAPDAEPDDGLVDVVVATSTGPLARLGFAVALRSGEHVGRDDVLVTRGRTVTVTGEAYPLNTDGELSGPHSARTWSVRPGAWSVVSPAVPAVPLG